ncbi:MAG: hypothetical protein A2Y23_01800 [Clostridiales bacterium GWB2_37_7]|nr:MAG: hypothetical protein A2Y23_01800 [Clostridiales bacterium GWB2_37_7]
MSIGASKILSLESCIEEARERLNDLMDRNTIEVTEEVLYLSRELDILINYYYYNQVQRIE